MTTFLVSKTYSIVTPESAKQGDYAEQGFEYQDQPMELRDLVCELRDCSELSAHPMTQQWAGHSWASTSPYVANYATGEERTDSIHIRAVDGSTVDGRRMMRIYRLAKLV